MGEVYIPRGARALFRVCASRCSSPPLSSSLSPPLRALQVSCHRHTKPRALIFALNLNTFLCPLLFLLPSLLCSLSFVFCLLASVRFRSIHFFASVIIDTVYPSRTDGPRRTRRDNWEKEDREQRTRKKNASSLLLISFRAQLVPVVAKQQIRRNKNDVRLVCPRLCRRRRSQ